MNLAFVLHLYQPSTQSESEFRKITSECYVPLIKLIKNKSDLHITLNLPLSLLDQFETYGYIDLLNQLHDLVTSEKVEVTGSGAYHPLLTKYDSDLITKQIILNEYALGYYFGQKQGFEGEPSILVKDLRGFFPPELAVSSQLLSVLDTLNYDWTVVDRSCLPDAVKDSALEHVVYKTKSNETKLVIRDDVLSNLLSFKRNADITDLVDYVLNRVASLDTIVVALDAEALGHHNREGIYVFDSFLDKLSSLGILLTSVSYAIDGLNPEKIETIKETTWGVPASDVSEDDEIYPYWDISSNKLHKALWKLSHTVTDHFISKNVPKSYEGYETVAIWKKSSLNTITDTNLRNYLALELQVLKSMQSDQFWWASNKKILDKTLYSVSMIKSALSIYKNLADMQGMMEIAPVINTQIEAIQDILQI